MVEFHCMSDTVIEMNGAHNGLLRVRSIGAKIEVSLRSIPLLGLFTRGDRKMGITHPCTPIFGPDRKNLYGLSQHGMMRNEVCQVKQEGNEIVVSHEIRDPGYPNGMRVEQRMQITDEIFSFVMTHTNRGEIEAAVNAGEHCYFDAPQGYRGTTINDQDITKLIEENYDGIAIDLKETNSIKIPGKPEYVLEQEGFQKAVVWVGKNPETKVIDQTYVCIEPVEDDPFGDFFGSPSSLITPRTSRSCRFSLQIIT